MVGDDLWHWCEQSKQRHRLQSCGGEKCGRGAQLQHRTFHIRRAAERFLGVPPKPRLRAVLWEGA